MNDLAHSTKITIVYYIHHHGSGHVSRAKLVLSALCQKYRVIILYASDHVRNALLKPTANFIFEKLPPKYSAQNPKSERTFNSAFEGIEYSRAPVARALRVCEIASIYKPELFISDVSAELSILFRSIGVRVLMQRHSGDISCDPTQVFAYECATALFAPYPDYIESMQYKYVHKTRYLGFASAFDESSPRVSKASLNNISILMNDSQKAQDIASLISPIAPSITIVGCEGLKTQGITWAGRVDDISQHIDSLVVISNAGNNAISELLSLGKKLILIPEQRPYDEQFFKADMLEKTGMAKVILDRDLLVQNSQKLCDLVSQYNVDKTNYTRDDITTSAATFSQQLVDLIEEVIDGR